MPDTDNTNDDVPPELQLDLPSYTGPMDLLVDLIREHQIDIFDIPISLITRRYLAYIEHLEDLDLQVGGEWLEMAATLVHIKSRMLLPDEPDDDEEEGPDPRDELVRRLIEHQLFQWAAERLHERPQLSRDFVMAPPRAEEERRTMGPPKLRPATLSDLVDALRRIIEERGDDEKWVYEITREELSLKGVILDISSRLRRHPRMEFAELFDSVDVTRHRIVTTFLALLEMTRLDMIRLFQPRLDDDRPNTIIIERAVIDIVDVSQSLDFPDFDS